MAFQDMVEKVMDWAANVKNEYPITAPVVDRLIGEKEKLYLPCMSKGVVLEVPDSSDSAENLPNHKWSVLTLNPSALFINQDEGKMHIKTAQRVSLLMDPELRGARPIVQLRNEQSDTRYAIFGTYTDYKMKKRFSATQFIGHDELDALAHDDSKWSQESKVIPISEINLSNNSAEQPADLKAAINIVRSAINQVDSIQNTWKTIAFNTPGIMIATELIGLGHIGLFSTLIGSLTYLIRYGQLGKQAYEIAKRNIDSPLIRSHANLFIS